MAKEPKTRVDSISIENQLGDQVDFLKRSVTAYDQGATAEYKRLATTLRVIFHQSPKSNSLANQLKIDNISIPSYARRSDPRNLVPEAGLAIIRLTDTNAEVLPALDFGPMDRRDITLDLWWNEPVLRDIRREFFSRKDFVLTVANQDGGSHVDSEIEAKYYRLLNDDSIFGVVSGPDGVKPLRKVERAYLRHITFEALQSLEPEYIRIVGKRYCYCGSGRQSRYCCLKGKSFNEVYAIANKNF